MKPNLADTTVEKLLLEPFDGDMRAIQIEGSDGVLAGGIIIVRGERNFDLVCQELNGRARG